MSTRKVLGSLPLDESPNEVSWDGDAIFCLQVAAENFLVDLLRFASEAAKHAGRETVQNVDMIYVRKLLNAMHPSTQQK